MLKANNSIKSVYSASQASDPNTNDFHQPWWPHKILTGILGKNVISVPGSTRQNSLVSLKRVKSSCQKQNDSHAKQIEVIIFFTSFLLVFPGGVCPPIWPPSAVVQLWAHCVWCLTHGACQVRYHILNGIVMLLLYAPLLYPTSQLNET